MGISFNCVSDIIHDLSSIFVCNVKHCKSSPLYNLTFIITNDHHYLGKIALFEPQSFLENSSSFVYSWDLDTPVSTCLDFTTVFLFLQSIHKQQ
jgi:hypothetical protein